MKSIFCVLTLLLVAVKCSPSREYTHDTEQFGKAVGDPIDGLSNEEARRIAVNFLRERQLSNNNFFRHRRLLEAEQAGSHHGICYFYHLNKARFMTVMQDHLNDDKIWELLSKRNYCIGQK